MDAFIGTSLEISSESDKKQVQFDYSPSETIYQAAEPPNSVRTVNIIPSSNDEFLVEAHLTSERTYTAPSVIDTSQYNLGQQENSQPTHHRYNLRSGDRMMSVREQCAAHLSSIRTNHCPTTRENRQLKNAYRTLGNNARSNCNGIDSRSLHKAP